jgi:hypothetical protein
MIQQVISYLYTNPYLWVSLSQVQINIWPNFSLTFHSKHKKHGHIHIYVCMNVRRRKRIPNNKLIILRIPPSIPSRWWSSINLWLIWEADEIFFQFLFPQLQFQNSKFNTQTNNGDVPPSRPNFSQGTNVYCIFCWWNIGWIYTTVRNNKDPSPELLYNITNS